MKRGAVEIRVGLGSCGVASGAEPVRDALERAAKQAGANGIIKTVGCNGMCHREPLVEVVEADGAVALYGNVTAETAREIARRHIRPNRIATRVRWKIEELKGWQAGYPRGPPAPPDAYLAKQKRIVLENCGSIDPLNIDDYLARDGYRALAMCLGAQGPIGDHRSLAVAAPLRFPSRDGAPPGPRVSMGLRPSQTDETERRGAACPWTIRGWQACGAESHLGFSSRRGAAIFDGAVGTSTAERALSPDDVIAAISDSGLRGRGGAGFPTGRKWALGRAQADPVKYVICNGDEGDPGAFMDRLVLESDPHRVLEGLAIAAFAIGAAEGFLYIRAEYPQAVRHTRAAIRQAEQRGFLGQNILGSAFSLRLEVREGAGAFVCGEETALIQSLEGKRGMPKLRPPYPVERGLRGHPTVINNVETLACVPWMIRHGAGAFAALGAANSRGTKVFALAGKINRGGLIEVPMGITIREVVEEIGGGIRNGRQFKAVQLGGPSGGCIPARLGHTPVDYDALAETGAIMGSGGLVVLDDRDCMVDIARFFLKFTQAESCGKCTFCRIGTKRMLEILERICDGKGRPNDLEQLEMLADYVGRASLCGLGQTAPNPVLTTLRYFRAEYEAHIHERRCPAGRCPALIRYRVTDNCIGCTLCAQACPVGAIAYRPYEKHAVDDRLCTRCDMCRQACKDDAIEVL
jgi:NADH:ubiquinone oxidoreductase subunit F (NADH-binding)/(2Fe-2S) ferredoxin